jgi:hypothetical protein
VAYTSASPDSTWISAKLYYWYGPGGFYGEWSAGVIRWLLTFTSVQDIDYHPYGCMTGPYYTEGQHEIYDQQEEVWVAVDTGLYSWDYAVVGTCG